jgi:uncharacterized linocin/CFP29 family protein
MNHLLRPLAPISDAGWELLDREARERLGPALAARKLVDFLGSLGWEHSATNLGRTTPLDSAPCEGVAGLQRRVLPLIEVRADFELHRAELRDADRGADDTDLEALDKATHQLAVAENAAVFHGWRGAITGLLKQPRTSRCRSAPLRTRILGRWRAPWSSSGAAGSPGRTDLRSDPSSTDWWSRPPSTAATGCSITC